MKDKDPHYYWLMVVSCYCLVFGFIMNTIRFILEVGPRLTTEVL
jgi:hypothetical protein